MKYLHILLLRYRKYHNTGIVHFPTASSCPGDLRRGLECYNLTITMYYPNRKHVVLLLFCFLPRNSKRTGIYFGVFAAIYFRVQDIKYTTGHGILEGLWFWMLVLELSMTRLQ